MIAADVALFLERADAAQTGRGRDPDTPRQFHVGHPTVVLQLGQDHAVDLVEFGPRHDVSSLVRPMTT